MEDQKKFDRAVNKIACGDKLTHYYLVDVINKELHKQGIVLNVISQCMNALAQRVHWHLEKRIRIEKFISDNGLTIPAGLDLTGIQKCALIKNDQEHKEAVVAELKKAKEEADRHLNEYLAKKEAEKDDQGQRIAAAAAKKIKDEGFKTDNVVFKVRGKTALKIENLLTKAKRSASIEDAIEEVYG